MVKSCPIKFRHAGGSVSEIFASGGFMMWPLLLCSILTVAITGDRYFALNQKKIAPDYLLAQVWTWIKKGELDGEKIRAIRANSPLGQILAAGLSNSADGREIMKDSMNAAASKVLHDLERFMGVLGTIAAISPLMGLLGTVFGMITVFTSIMLEGTGNAGVLAGGISEALITTAAGLCVAIPAMILHRYFLRVIDTCMIRMEQDATKLVDALHSSNRKVNLQAL